MPVPDFGATYDPTLGFPTAGYIDYDARLFDDEFIFHASDVRPLR